MRRSLRVSMPATASLLCAALTLSPSTAYAEEAAPLAGRTVVIDAGHQLGNANFPDEINRLVDAGGFKKPCNTTGTATRGGYPEATFNFRVAKKLERRLEALGATVVQTRKRNSEDLWGPCVDKRGRAGNPTRSKPGADLKISIHGDGSLTPGHRGFHLIVSTRKSRHRAASREFAIDLRATLGRAGFPRSTYIGKGSALSPRGDIATVNLSRMPTVMAELGNMRNAGDARVMRSKKGQQRYARALARGVERFLGTSSAQSAPVDPRLSEQALWVSMWRTLQNWLTL